MNEPIKSNASDKQRGSAVVELLFAAATLGTATLVAVMDGPKIPVAVGD